MNRKFLFVFLFLFAASPLAAEMPGSASLFNYQRAGLIFDIYSAKNVFFSSEQITLCSEQGQRQMQNSASELAVFALDLRVRNSRSTLKLDLPGNAGSWWLTDEFSNVYRQLCVRDGNAAPARVALYPGQGARQQLFFEQPLTESRLLFLHAKDLVPENEKEFSFPLPLDKLRRAGSVLSGRIPVDTDLAVLIENPDKPVPPGASVSLRVTLDDNITPPDKIYLLSAGYMLEDEKTSGHYDIRVPDDLPDGPFVVVVMARWDTGGSEHIISRTVTIPVTKQ